MIDKNRILDFIETFNNRGKWKQVVECFTCGNCFWFAYILHGRFVGLGDFVAVVYDDIENHFGCQIGKDVYDITGIVTNQYNWELWDEVKKRDALHASHIERDCILKEVREDD